MLYLRGFFTNQTIFTEMKSNLMYTISAAMAAIAAVSSCKTDNSPTYFSYMTAVKEQPSSQGISYLVADDSTIIFPTEWPDGLYGMEHNQRLFATFTIPSGEITDPLYAEFSTVSQIRQDTIAHTSATSGKGDPIFINAAWKSGGIYGADKFLTLSFTFRGAGYTPHKFELSDEENAISNPDPMGYYLLTFKHDNSNEPDAYPYNGVITYPLTAKYTDGIKGLKIRFSTSSSPSAKDSTITVKY